MRVWTAINAILNASISLTLFGLAALVGRVSIPALGLTKSPEDFGGAMLMGAFSMLVLMIAVFLSLVALGSFILYRRLRRVSSISKMAISFVCLATFCPAALALFFLLYL